MSAAASDVTPAIITQALISHELPAITAWASRHDWEVTADSAALRLLATVSHPAYARADIDGAAAATVVFHADLAGYPAHPPAWWCGSSPADRQGYPAPGITPGVLGSIFHTQPCICAPWNRLAYAAYSGPHPDWTALGDWKSTALQYTQAQTVGDMLSTLRLHLQHSPGMML